jgi:hypothetical protein
MAYGQREVAGSALLYVQFKSGDSYLKERQSDGAEVFHIKNPCWADYWQQQAYAVMLVIRTSDGEIRWVDVSAFLDHSIQSPERFSLEGIFSKEPWASSRDCRFR